ncbi:hypothetical protein ASE00_05800 [Sphingomonas sp. Root710]|nr:hypothetical protein ASE00_05800 [Sphingomonas sp. Root710]
MEPWWADHLIFVILDDGRSLSLDEAKKAVTRITRIGGPFFLIRRHPLPGQEKRTCGTMDGSSNGCAVAGSAALPRKGNRGS